MTMHSENFTSFIFALLVSILLFATGNPNVIIYLVFVGLIWAALSISFCIKKNIEFFLSADAIAIANLLAYLFQKGMHGRTICNSNRYKLLAIAIYAVVLLIICIACLLRRKKYTGHKLEVLFPQREDDLERVEKYLHSFRAIGIEGEWGSGKTLLVNHLEEEYKKDKFAETDHQENIEYIYAEIHLMSCDLDNIADVIINTISNILRSEHIFSRSLPRLKNFMASETWLKRLGFSFTNDGTYTDAINNLKNELEALGNKKIVLIFEDIDRIQNPDVIKKVFSISEDLSRSSSIKLIYEYDQYNLEHNVDECFTRDYIEKYIPFTISLTPIPLDELIKIELDVQKKRENPDRKGN